MISQRVEGVTPEMFDWYQRDMPNHLPKYQKMITIKLLENEADGTPVMHQRIFTPTFSFSSNRSLILSFYDEKRPDGSMLFVGGSVGNETFVQKYSGEIGSDVIASCALNAREATPVKDAGGKVIACDVVYVLDTDVSGTLPDFVK